MCNLGKLGARPLRDNPGMTRDEVIANLREHGVVRLSVFGSTARGDRRSDADVDLVAKFGLDEAAFVPTRKRTERSNAVWSGSARPAGLSDLWQRSSVRKSRGPRFEVSGM